LSGKACHGERQDDVGPLGIFVDRYSILETFIERFLEFNVGRMRKRDDFIKINAIAEDHRYGYRVLRTGASDVDGSLTPSIRDWPRVSVEAASSSKKVMKAFIYVSLNG